MEEFYLFDQFDKYLCKMHNMKKDLLLRLTDEIMSEKDTNDFIYYSFNEEFDKAQEVLEKYKNSFNEEGVTYSNTNLDELGIIILGKGNNKYFFDANTSSIRLIIKKITPDNYPSLFLENNLFVGFKNTLSKNTIELFIYDLNTENLEFYNLDDFIDSKNPIKPNLHILKQDLLLLEITQKNLTQLIIFDLKAKTFSRSYSVDKTALISSISKSSLFDQSFYFNFYLEENVIHCQFAIDTFKYIYLSDITINTLKINKVISIPKETKNDFIFHLKYKHNYIFYLSNNNIGIVKCLNKEFHFINNIVQSNIKVFIFSKKRNSIIIGSSLNEIIIIDINSNSKIVFEIKTRPIKIIENLNLITVFCEKGFIYLVNNENFISEKRIIYNDENEPLIITKN